MFNPDRVDLDNFKPGNIIYLHLTNFQTFKEQEFYFGDSLNLIAAPNGTGKSSLANALAFVFNGSHKTIGKETKELDFINFHATSAEIVCVVAPRRQNTLKLQSQGPKRTKGIDYTVLKRTITKDKKVNAYSINGEVYKKKDYEKYVSSLGIDCTNLTNFLPQEKVGSFCRMNGFDLFKEVFKPVKMDDISVVDHLEQFEETKASLAVKHRDIDSLSKRITILDCKRTNMRRELDKLRQFEKNMRIKKLILYKEVWLTAQEMSRAKATIDTDIKQLVKSITRFEKELVAIDKKLKELKNSEVSKEYYAKTEEFSKDNKKAAKVLNELKGLHNEMLDVQEETKKKEEENRKIEIENRDVSRKKKDIEVKIVEKYEEFKKIVKLNNPVSDIKEILHSQTHDNAVKLLNYEETVRKIDSQLDASILQLKYQSSEIQKQIERLEREKLNYSQEKGQRLLKLKEMSFDTYKAVEYLRTNDIGVRFYEPLFLHIEVETDYKMEIGHLLTYQAMTSFLVTSNEDIRTLARVLKDEMRLAVNISVVGQSNQRRVDFDKNLVDGSAIDFISAPNEIYRHYLINSAAWHMIPIVKRRIDESEIFNRYTFVKRMITAETLIERRTNKYNPDFISSSMKIRPTNHFDKSVKIDFKEIDRKLGDLKLKREELKSQAEVKYEQRQKEKELEETETRRQESKKGCFYVLRRCMDSFYSLQMRQPHEINHNKVRQIKEKFNRCQLKILEIPLKKLDFNKIKEVEFEATNLIKQKHEHTHDNNAYKETLKNSRVRAEKYGQRLKENQDLLTEMEMGEARRNRDNETVKSRIKDFKANTSRDILEDYSKVLDFTREIKELPDTTGELRTKLYEIEEMNRALDPDGEVKKTYNKANSEFVSEKEQQDRLYLELEQIKKECLEKKNKIVVAAHKFLDVINGRFKSMFQRFGYEGEVRLFVGEASNDPVTADLLECAFELQIWVKFREGEELQQLAHSKQSGGEKSLSTVLFLLALQEEGNAFRLVDEINQGMDEKNERRVFEVLSAMKGQFFIITPKLIDSFHYPDMTKVLVLYGGERAKMMDIV